MYTLVASKRDPASNLMAEYLVNRIGFIRNENISYRSQSANHLRNHETPVAKENCVPYDSYAFANMELYVSHNKSLLHLDNLDKLFPYSEAFIFLSRHSSESGIPTLTCHFTGNFTENNQYGGFPRELGICYPYLQKQFIKEINNNRSSVLDYEITIEATHHGPTSLKKPLLFIEIGSTEKQWADTRAASVVCDILISILTRKTAKTRCRNVGIALGGTHYPKKFNQILLESEFGLAAVAPRHNLKSVDDSMIDQMISKSFERVTHGIVDRKGLGKEKNRILELIDKKNLELLEL
ncbi:MAG: D-aminoacyl-tRNA deacylase [Nitrososphaeraceae archaeon]